MSAKDLEVEMSLSNRYRTQRSKICRLSRGTKPLERWSSYLLLLYASTVAAFGSEWDGIPDSRITI